MYLLPSYPPNIPHVGKEYCANSVLTPKTDSSGVATISGRHFEIPLLLWYVNTYMNVLFTYRYTKVLTINV